MFSNQRLWAQIRPSASSQRRDSIYFNGKYHTPADYRLLLKEEEKTNFDTYFMPGAAFVYFMPKGADSIGVFSGIAVEYLIYASMHQSDESGPSHTRIYGKLGLLNSDKDSKNPMFVYSLGLDLSIERNPRRNYMIPYFGVEFGGISQKKFGGSLQFTPTFGLHVLSKKNLFVNLQGGYMYPLRNFESLRGWMYQAGLNFSLW